MFCGAVALPACLAVLVGAAQPRHTVWPGHSTGCIRCGFPAITPIAIACNRFRPHLLPAFLAGRADYFGEMPNLAARVAGLAHPGQILVEGTSGFTSRSSSGSHAPSPALGATVGGIGDRSFNKDTKRNDMVNIMPSWVVQ